ncbi:MAG: GTPase, partial [Thermoplasmataceae archaeon]
MLNIGLVGKPNVGKSTIFSAITSVSADIGNYPFTTTKPNVGVAFLKTPCPHTEIGKQCNPREGRCDNGTRFVPVEITDVPGLIPGSSQGKGMGNEFMDNIREAKAIIHVFDASGRTDADGNPLEENRDPIEDIEIIEQEIVGWLGDRIYRDWEKFGRKADSTGERIEASLSKKLSSFGLAEKDIMKVLSDEFFPGKLALWDKSDAERFARAVLLRVKTLIRAGNKADRITAAEAERITSKYPGTLFISGEFELALEKAMRSGIIDRNTPGFVISPKASDKQAEALEKVRRFISQPWITRIGDLIGTVVKGLLGYIVVYPVHDDSNWSDSQGNILPDALLV